MATGHTYGNHGGALVDDVVDEIFQITPEDTPFYNMIGDGPANNTHHQWMTRALTTRADNARGEGFAFGDGGDSIDDPSFQDPALPSRVTNVTQILAKLPQVSRSANSSAWHGGIEDLMADQVELRSIEWKTDAEHALLRGSLSYAASNDSTARRLGGFYNVVTTNVNDYGSNGTFDEDKFLDILQEIWDQGGRPTDVLVGARIKRNMAKFDNIVGTKFLQATNKQIVNMTNTYESDFGLVEIAISRDVPNTLGTLTLFAFDRSFFKKAWIDTPFIERLPKTIDGHRASIIGELTLEYGNEAAAGQIQDLAGLS